jgi:hypothetical protein
MKVEELERVRNEIEAFPEIHQEQIHALLLKGRATIQYTSQGALLNLGTLSDELLAEIIQYANYVKEQEASITKDEEIKDELRENYFGASAEQV